MTPALGGGSWLLRFIRHGADFRQRQGPLKVEDDRIGEASGCVLKLVKIVFDGLKPD